MKKLKLLTLMLILGIGVIALALTRPAIANTARAYYYYYYVGGEVVGGLSTLGNTLAGFLAVATAIIIGLIIYRSRK